MPFTEGKTHQGWGVFRSSPWEFVGLFETKEQADAKAQEMGPEYQVAFGEQQEGTDNFVYSDTDQP
jgi:hypothetical protein